MRMPAGNSSCPGIGRQRSRQHHPCTGTKTKKQQCCCCFIHSHTHPFTLPSVPPHSPALLICRVPFPSQRRELSSLQRRLADTREKSAGEKQRLLQRIGEIETQHSQVQVCASVCVCVRVCVCACVWVCVCMLRGYACVGVACLSHHARA